MRFLPVVPTNMLVGFVLLLAMPAFGQERTLEESTLGTADPAAVYCRELGYGVEIVKTEDGERCICILPNGERCDAWDFYRGRCWPEYSYCARQGYGTETRTTNHGSFTTECAVCIAADGTEVGSVAELMDLEEKYIVGTGVPVISRVSESTRVDKGRERSLPAAFNWCDLGGCSSVKSQGYCGSCWAFATVGPLECNILIRDSVEVDISEQWLVSCNQDGWSCGGGWWAHDYHEWKTDPCLGTGAVLEEDFPYEANNLPCQCPYPHEYLILDWNWITIQHDIPPVEQIKQALYDYGPITVGVYVTDAFQAYDGGVFAEHASGEINHGVTLVGWNDNEGTAGAWTIKNSWTSLWGEDGYMRLEYGCNLVGYAAAYIDYQCMDACLVKADGSGDYSTIQAAIDSMGLSCACVIELEDGTYTGAGNRDLQIHNRWIVIRSSSGNPDLCLVDCGSVSRFATVSTSGERTSLTLEGIGVTNGSAAGAGECGGAIWCEGAPLKLQNCKISNSGADGDGGAVCCDSSAINISDCTFEGNSSGGAGGGIFLGEAAVLVIDGSVVNGNHAGFQGGGMAGMPGAHILISSCTFSGNSTDSASVDGRGGGLFCSSYELLEGCVFSGNWSAGAGGGAYVSPGAGSDLYLTRCTVTGNYSQSTGGGIDWDSGANVHFERTICWGNSAGSPEGEIYVGGGVTAELACCDMDSSGIGGPGTVTWLWSNQHVEPGFCDAVDWTGAPTTGGDYHLKDVSPCADGNAPPVCRGIGALDVGCTQSVMTVCGDGSGDFLTTQDAVDAAPWYDVVELCDGTHAGPGNRDIDLGGKTLTIRSQSGNAESCIIDCEGQGRAFHFHSGELPRCGVENVTIKNGSAGNGAALCCEGSSPTITGCIIHDCAADQSGGAIYCGDSSPALGHCTFAENSAVSGAGLYCSSSAPVLEHTIIAFGASGGAVCCDSAGAPALSCCNLYGNAGGDWVGCVGSLAGVDGNFSADPVFCDTATSNYRLDSTSPCRNAAGCGLVGAVGVGCWRGWVWRVPSQVPTIQTGIDSAVAGDTVVVACGTYAEYGISMKDGVTLRSETGIPDCVTLDAGGLGRILTCYDADSTTSIGGFTFTGGQAFGPIWPYNAGGAVYFENASPRVFQCVFDGNSSEWGGALTCRGESPRIAGCTFINNSATGTGAGIYSYYSDLQLERSIIAFSTQGSGLDGYKGSASVSCCDVYGNAGGDWVNWAAGLDSTGGNFSSDPCFCEPYTGHIAAISPCAPDKSPVGCDLIGALGVGCELTPVAGEEVALPSKLFLGPAVPNPFNPVAEISYGIPAAGGRSRVVMNVYNALGRRVRTLVDADQGPGMYRVIWDGTDHHNVPVSSGVYFYRITWNGKSETKRMVLLK